MCIIQNITEPQQHDIHSVWQLHVQGSFFLDLEAHKAEESVKITRIDQKLPQRCKSKDEKIRTEKENHMKTIERNKKKQFHCIVQTHTRAWPSTNFGRKKEKIACKLD